MGSFISPWGCIRDDYKIRVGEIIVDFNNRGYYITNVLSKEEIEKLDIHAMLKKMFMNSKGPFFLAKLAYTRFPHRHVEDMRRLKKRIFYYAGHELCEFKIVSGMIKFGMAAVPVENYITWRGYSYIFSDTRKAIEEEIRLLYEEMESRDTIKLIRERA